MNLTAPEILLALPDPEGRQRRAIRLSTVRPCQRVRDEGAMVLDHRRTLRHLQFAVDLSGQQYEIDEVLNAVEQGVALRFGHPCCHILGHLA